MTLQDDLLKKFADLLKPKNDNRKNERVVYASVSRLDGDQVYITLDGSDIETPANSLVEVAAEDRVMVSIKDHNVVVTGNISYPSITRVGDSYITLRSDGLLIGQLDKTTGVPIGTYMVVGADTITMYDNEGNPMVSANSTDINLGNASLEFNESTGVLDFIVDESVNSFNLIKSGGTYSAEINVDAGATDGKIRLRIINDSTGTTVSQLELSNTGVTNVTGTLKWGGYEVVRINTIAAVGTAYITNLTVGANTAVIVKNTVNPPSGYLVVGVCGYRTGAATTGTYGYDKSICVNEVWYDRSTKTMHLKIVNHTSTKVTGVAAYLQWFALKASQINTGTTVLLK